jgi:hypothetical protein
VLALLGKARVVDDPRFNRMIALDNRQDLLANAGHKCRIRPAALSDKMQQGLVLGRYPVRPHDRRQRLHRLALQRQKQPRAIVPQRLRPIRMADHPDKAINIRLKHKIPVIRHAKAPRSPQRRA